MFEITLKCPFNGRTAEIRTPVIPPANSTINDGNGNKWRVLDDPPEFDFWADGDYSIVLLVRDLDAGY